MYKLFQKKNKKFNYKFLLAKYMTPLIRLKQDIKRNINIQENKWTMKSAF